MGSSCISTLVYDMSSDTVAVNNQTPSLLTEQIQLKIHLSVNHPRAEDHSYKLLFYCNRDSNSSSSSSNNLYTECKVRESKNISFSLNIFPSIANTLYIWLFCDTFIGGTQTEAQILLGCGSVATRSLFSQDQNSVSLIDNSEKEDEDGKENSDREQGIVTLEWIPSRDTSKNLKHRTQWAKQFEMVSPDLRSSIANPRKVIAKKQIKRIQDMYTMYEHKKDLQYFSYIRTPIGRLPLSCVPLLSLYDLQFKDEEAELLFERLFYFAGIITGHTMDSKTQQDHFDKLVNSDKLEWFCEMMLLMSKSFLYVNDEARSRNGKLKFVDQWVRLGTFPDLNTVGFDCDDAAEYALGLITAFQRLNIKQSKPLKKLQLLLAEYTIFLAIGQINLNPYDYSNTVPDYTAHAFLIGLDNNYIYDMLVASDSLPTKGKVMMNRSCPPEYNPSLVIDPTNYQESVWRKRTSSSSPSPPPANLIEPLEVTNTRITIQENKKVRQLVGDIIDSLKRDNNLNFNKFVSVKQKEEDSYNDDVFDCIVHTKTPIDEVRKIGIYGPLTALIANRMLDPRDDTDKPMHILCVNSSNPTKSAIGVNIHDLLDNKEPSRKLRLIIGSEINELEEKQLVIDMSGLPSVNLPVVTKNELPTTTSIINNNNNNTKDHFMFFRYQDYMIPSYKDNIQYIVKKAKETDKICNIREDTWELANKVKLYVFIYNLVQ